MGFFDVNTRSVSIYKWRARFDTFSIAQSATPELSQCVSAALFTAVLRTGSSKVLLTELSKTLSKDQPIVLQLWILNNNIVYTATKQTTPTVAMKVLYKQVDSQEAERLLAPITSEVQELSLPRDEIRTISELLGASSRILPESERTFTDWKVGLLKK